MFANQHFWEYATLQQQAFLDRFHFIFEDIKAAPDNINEFINNIINKYQAQKLYGVLGTYDYPESIIAAIIAREFGLHGMDPAIAFVCQHKYYSRVAQKKIIPFAVPKFQHLPIDNLKRDDINLSYPFFVKPVKSVCSILARPIDDFETLEAFLPKVRRHFSQYLPPFNTLLKKYTTFDFDANLLIAEQMLDGAQFTVEGFSWNRQVSIMGITDSIMYPGTMSFERFEYPSRLPIRIQQRMADIARQLILKIGLDYTVFNIEMFYNCETDAIHIIEINPRMSKQFADIFEKVDGTNTYAVQLQLSMGKQPEFEKGKGSFGVAASFVLRLFENKIVTRIPTQEELNKIHTLFPDSMIIFKVKEGNMLSDLGKDEKSYR